MRINHQVVVFDAADIATESEFWAGVLGGLINDGDDWHMVLVDGAPRVAVQRDPDHRPPDWPDGPTKQQIHLDLWVDDIAAARDEVIALGATFLRASDHGSEDLDDYQVYADPAGHPFCLCWLK